MDSSEDEVSINSASSPYRSPAASPGNPSSPAYLQEPTSSPPHAADFPVSSPSRDACDLTSPMKYGKRKEYKFYEPLVPNSSKCLRIHEDDDDDEDLFTIQDNSDTSQLEHPQSNNDQLFQHCDSTVSENLNDMVLSSPNFNSQIDQNKHNVDSLQDGDRIQNSCDLFAQDATNCNSETVHVHKLEENNVLAAQDNWAEHIVYSDSSSEDDVGFETESSSESDFKSSSSSSSCEDESSSSSSELEHRSNSSDSEQVGSDSDSDVDFVSPSVYNGCSLTVDEAVLELMNLYLQHTMEKTALGDTLKSVLRFLPKYNNMPKSKHSLLKYVSDLCPLSKERVHFYCSICHYYLGEEEICCTLCGGECKKFYQLPLADQIKNLFENHGLADEIDKYEARKAAANQEGVIKDLCDGTVIKNVKSAGPYNLTLIGHTDGLSLSESSNVSMWPLEFVIAELPPHLRYKYVLISGIWIDDSKPNMNSYLKPFVEEISVQNENGVQWVHPKSQVVHQTSVIVPLFIADAPARAQLQNILSHGGRHCCNICEQKMKRLPAEPLQPGVKRRKRRRVFTFEEEEAVLRTAERMKAQGKQSRKRQEMEGGELKAIKGVRGRSILESLPGCDISTVVFPEYMHALLVLIKHLMKILFTKSGPWSLSNKQDIINEFLENIRVPDFITRIPRSTEYSAKWKANEYRSFLLYYSCIIFRQCMKEEYFQHWMLLVMSFYLLLQDCITEIDIAKATAMLQLFCADFSRLYKAEFFTYYVHNILHLPLVVKRYGPLWSHSAFQFENFNGKLVKFIHGSKHQAKELVNNINLAFGVAILEGRVRNQNISFSKEAIELKNRVSSYSSTKTESELLTATFQDAQVNVYYRARVRHEVYTSTIYKRQKRRNNFTISYFNTTSQKLEYGVIKYFCEVSNSRVAIVQKFDVDHLRCFTLTGSGIVLQHILPIVLSNQTNIIHLTEIRCKVIRVNDYLCLRPNSFEVNL